MQDIVIRYAITTDLDAIAEISRLTWEGEDYLEGRSREWIEDSTLYVGELQGKVVGTFRISAMPGGVLWLEALRIHADFRGRGLGKSLSWAAFDMGKKEMETGMAECMEFSTYINNHESIHIANAQGFRVVNRFMLMTRDGLEPTEAALETVTANPSDFSCMRGHIPCGWKYPRASEEGIEWALESSGAFSCNGARFLRKRGEDETTPLASALSDPESYLDGVEALARAGGQDYSCIVFHGSRKGLLRTAFERGYETWEPVGGFNVLVFRYDG